MHLCLSQQVNIFQNQSRVTHLVEYMTIRETSHFKKYYGDRYKGLGERRVIATLIDLFELYLLYCYFFDILCIFITKIINEKFLYTDI